MTQARKRFGQNFLEPVWVEKVIRAIDPKPDEAFIEVGPGRGALTGPLAARALSVVAYEIDRDLAAELASTAPSNVTVVQCDFLELPTSDQRLGIHDQRLGTHDHFRVAGNLPYNVASPILFKLVELYGAGIPLVDATVMLQREVADRLIAGPGTREYGVLSVLIQHSATVERMLNLPPGAFRPAPRGRSALVRLRFHPPAPRAQDPAGFVALVQAVFTRRRKTLLNALLAYQPAPSKRGRTPFPEVLARAGLDGTRRPETLSVAEFVRLSDSYPRRA